MSGIVCILNLDGQPVDRDLLQTMTNCMTYRGPHAQHYRQLGQVGMGHTLLRTTFESEWENQPSSLDGKSWIVADVCVDDRQTLKDQLRASGLTALDTLTDEQLILHAYTVWGCACVEHLLGDFAFVIWDGESRRLFCARDHFGVKPLYYTRLAKSLVVSNTLNCIRLHPQVSGALNEAAIGDFLLFGQNQDLATTVYQAIKRLPPAHTLTWTGDTLVIQRYWELPLDEPLHYAKPSDYVERFQELFSAAVADRLRMRDIGVAMSGGMDSTSVAAMAKRLLDDSSAVSNLNAHCIVYDSLIPDQERYWSGLAANYLKIPIRYLNADHYDLFKTIDDGLI